MKVFRCVDAAAGGCQALQLILTGTRLAAARWAGIALACQCALSCPPSYTLYGPPETDAGDVRDVRSYPATLEVEGASEPELRGQLALQYRLCQLSHPGVIRHVAVFPHIFEVNPRLGRPG